MTSSLRKAHKFIWIFITILSPVPLFFILFNLNFSTPKESVNRTFQSKVENTYTNSLIEVQLDNKTVNVFVKETLKSAASSIYSLDNNGNRLENLGQITSSGFYYFEAEKHPSGIIIYDEIKNMEITKLIF